MTENQTKAKRALEIAQIKPYCKRVQFLIYDLDKPLKNGDCNDSIELSLGNAIAYLFKVKDSFKDFPEINTKLIRQISYNRSKTIKVIKKHTNQRLKVVLKSNLVSIVNWPKVESKLWIS